ncbi:Retinol dehydrogenase 5 [Mortierella sp. AD031]|nr:Retinol dehydrogenase 5 [Mortierella sp. AD031]KAG0220330.1 Retinol dehydrogenase 5 [Mortierella sp. NVP41]
MSQYTLTNPEFRVVVVTGCDTGFGAEIVEDLYQLGGYTIYATCLTAEAISNYQAKDSTRIRPIQLDVTKQEDVNRLRAQIEAECPQGVYSVVNNAGINIGGHFDMTTEDAFERVMSVNYMGIVRITKGLLPSLRAYAKSRHTLPQGQDLPRARLISVTSVAGRVSAPGLGSYCASKHAAESLVDTLRIELSPWEIDVSMLEPFFAKTPIVANSLAAAEQHWKNASEEIRRMYGSQFMDGAKERNKQFNKNAVMPSAWVVQAAVNAIHKKNGARKPRILVGFWYVRFLVWFAEVAPSWVTDGLMRMGMRRSGHWAVDPFLLKHEKEE